MKPVSKLKMGDLVVVTRPTAILSSWKEEKQKFVGKQAVVLSKKCRSSRTEIALIDIAFTDGTYNPYLWEENEIEMVEPFRYGDPAMESRALFAAAASHASFLQRGINTILSTESSLFECHRIARAYRADDAFIDLEIQQEHTCPLNKSIPCRLGDSDMGACPMGDCVNQHHPKHMEGYKSILPLGGRHENPQD